MGEIQFFKIDEFVEEFGGSFFQDFIRLGEIDTFISCLPFKLMITLKSRVLARIHCHIIA